MTHQGQLGRVLARGAVSLIEQHCEEQMTKKELILLCLRAHEEIPLHLPGRCTVGLNFEPNLCAASYIAF